MTPQEQERAAVIEWLEAKAGKYIKQKRPNDFPVAAWNARQTAMNNALHLAAIAIERGEHLNSKKDSQ